MPAGLPHFKYQLPFICLFDHVLLVLPEKKRKVYQMDHHTQFGSFDCFPITKTCLYNFDPIKPHFYIVKLGYTEVYIIFLIFAQNIDCGYSLEPPRRGGSNGYPKSMF